MQLTLTFPISYSSASSALHQLHCINVQSIARVFIINCRATTASHIVLHCTSAYSCATEFLFWYGMNCIKLYSTASSVIETKIENKLEAMRYRAMNMFACSYNRFTSANSKFDDLSLYIIKNATGLWRDSFIRNKIVLMTSALNRSASLSRTIVEFIVRPSEKRFPSAF